MMKFAMMGSALAFVLAACAAPTADNGSCKVGKSGDELSYEEANAVYECIADALHAGYKTGDKRWVNADFVNNYRSWTYAATLPANPGFHSDRFLLTWVNQTGAAEYLKYAENPNMPAGSVLVKESFSVTEAGDVEKGPLFIMEKVAAGTSPNTGDWFYSMVAPGGAPVAVNVKAACSTCHEGFAEQGNMGYPVEEVRIGG